MAAPRRLTVPPSLFQRDGRYRGRKAPPEFEWVAVQMDITRWVITGGLSLIALGVWTGGLRLYDLTHKADQAKLQAIENKAINDRQDAEIDSLKETLTKHQVYLEQILSAVRKINN
jgi:hypothetical protein